MRFDHFILQQSNDLIRAIRKENVKSIHERIIDGLPVWMPFLDPSTNLGLLLRSLTADLIQWYTRTVKKCVLYTKVVNPVYKDERIILRFKQLKLPNFPEKVPAPRMGKVSCPDYPYDERSTRLQTLHFSSVTQVLRVIKWLYDRWFHKFQHYRFMDIELTELVLPCKLEAFRKLQGEFADRTMKLLQKEFRRAFMDQLLDHVQDVFDFFQSNMKAYPHGALYKLLRVLDLRLGTVLRTVLTSSLDEWLSFVNKYTSVKEMSSLSDVSESSEDMEPLQTPTHQWRRVFDIHPRETETIFGIYCHPKQLFQVQLVVNTNSGSIELEPSVEELQRTFTHCVEKMVTSLRSLTSVDNEIMSLLNLDTRILFNIGAGDPLYVDVDSMIRKTKQDITSKIANAMDQPLTLASMFSKYMWLLEDEIDEILDSIASANPPPSRVDYFRELKKFDDAYHELTSMCFHNEAFSLVEVSVDNAKGILCNRAKDLRDGLGSLVATEARQRNVHVIQRYNAILDRIAKKPANEKELSDLRQFIEDSKETIYQLQSEVADIRALLGLLDYFHITITIEDMGLSWSTLEYPSRVEASGREMEILLEADKIRMMDRLAVQKDQFERVIENLGKQVQAAKLLDDFSDKEKIVEKINALMDNIEQAKEKALDFNMREKVFGFVTTDYVILDQFTNELNPFFKLWNMIADYYNSCNDWLGSDVKLLDGKKIEDDISDWWKTSYKLAKSLEEEFPGAAACAMILREETTEFKKKLPVIQCLASKALKPRHWVGLSELLNTTFDVDEEVTLQQLFDLHASEHIEAIEEITMRAEKQYSLEKSLMSMKKEWETIDVEVKAYRESGTYVVGGIDEIITLLDDHIVKTQTMRGSPYIEPIEAECKHWEYKLKYGQSMLDALITCQRTWMYLEPIFSSEDIVKQLPTEARRFNGVDSLWRKTMNEYLQDPNFMTQAEPDKRLEEKLKRANEKLEEITKGLNDYLETKRLYFPRFFFLSNDELLEILSQTKDPKAVQPHLSKCFEGINKVSFEADLKISSMISAEGEVVKFDHTVDPESSGNKGNVEKWLLELEQIQWESIRSLTEAAIEDYLKLDRKTWILRWPAQVILSISCLYWTRDVTTALANNGGSHLLECNQKLDQQLREMVNLVRGELSKLERLTLGALTTIDVHNRDVVSKMKDLDIRTVDDFEWMSQLRYYWEDSWKDGQGIRKSQKTLVAKIVNAKCLYGYEYLGNTSRLVITALTDRCYRTMIGAIDMLHGGSNEGPAGTGKTETVKDLSKAIAMQCVVFNCSDGLDYLAMAKFFKGLAGCGSWCCFDEFNRIDIEVLSVIAQQILLINQAKRESREMFHFEGTYMKINSNCNVFITMNPGYAGRAELPDNLKALFRPCAMMVPDYAMIGEIRLYSFGFESARENAQKIVRVLQLSSEQLSSQKHYDYGMRAVNSILIAAGNLRQQLGSNPLWDESKIVLRSINDVNLAKFLVEDLPLFRGITSDLFPGVSLPKANYEVLEESLVTTANEGIDIAPGNTYLLQPRAEYITKAIQLYEMILVRHGVMIVGQTCAGKTATIHNLAHAMTHANASHPESFEKVHIFSINPKAVTSGQLYGQFDPNTNEWSDGIVAKLFRESAYDTSSDRKWLMFDGPVDAVWIENMNTVLDDNKKLCLVSGEIIRMSNAMTMVFEAEDLDNASPATVSRVGMIFCETRNIGWEAVRNVWLKSALPEGLKSYQNAISALFDVYFPPLTYYISKYCNSPTFSTSQELIFSLTRVLSTTLDFEDGVSSSSSGDMQKIIEGSFIYSLIWSVGVCIDSQSRHKFDLYMRSLLAATCVDSAEYQDFLLKNPDYEHSKGKATSNPIPENGLVYDYYYDAKAVRWVHWLDTAMASAVLSLKIDKDAKFGSIVIPTVDTIRHEWVIEKLLFKGYHVMCTGETGTAKSVTIKNKLLQKMPKNYNSIFINFSAQSTANQTQDLIDSKLDKRRKGVLGPPLGIKTVVFVDDLNMPEKEIYGAQPPIEILRQWMDHQGWYDRKTISYRRLVDIQFIVAMGPPGGGRTQITKRYVRHFNVINFNTFSDESLARVFGTIIDWKFSLGSVSSAIKQVGPSVVNATIDVYNNIAKNLLPTPAKSHYTFNLRDLSKVFQGILQYDFNTLKEKEQVVKLWTHESMRVFQDRLVDDIDRQWFQNLLKSTIQVSFYPSGHVPPTLAVDNSLIYCNFSDPKSIAKPYIEIIDRKSLEQVMFNYLEDFNSMTSKPMNLVLFTSAIESIARISRIINQPNGNALLVGVGGSGRKSLTILAIYIAEFELFRIEISKNYSMVDWRNDIKSMMHKAGVQNKPTVFLLDDNQIVKETILEDINGILNTGEVANLFNNEEMNALSDSMMKACADAKVNTGSSAAVYDFFLSRVRENLHLVLCFSPIGELFRTRLRKFPSLVNCCSIIWFTEWDDNALRSVANHFLANIDLDANRKDGVVEVCVDMQQRAVTLSRKYHQEMGRFYYVTPTSYLEVINTFKNLLSTQRKDILDSKARYDNGLKKLKETAEEVNSMQIYLEDLQPQLKQATIDTDALLVKITEDRKIASEQSILVEAEALKCNAQADEAKQLKDSCELDLAEAIPALQAAENALKDIKKSDIVEMKSMLKPPEAIRMTMAAVCIMLNQKPDRKGKAGDPYDGYWITATKEVLNDVKFLSRLLDYDRDSIDPAIINKITAYTNDPNFTPDNVAKRGSQGAAGLVSWVHAMVLYDRVAKQVAPKRAALKKAESTLKIAQETLAVKQLALKEVTDKVAALEVSLNEAESKKLSLKNQVEDCEAKLKRADALIKGLGGEKVRWTETSQQLQSKYANVTGDILLSAGVIAYLGAFTAPYRDDAIHQWATLLQSKSIPCSNDFTLRDTLGNAVTIRSWIINRLPNDSFSIENAIMLTKSNRWPLMIDPQGQANKWIKKLEEANGLKVVKQSQGNFIRTIENAIQFGNPVLIENIGESIDPILEPLLLKQVVMNGGVGTVKLGDTVIEYDPNFRLYMTTKLRNPHYPPELCVKVNLLNFMATSEGLQDQMLAKVVAMEQKELEATRQQLIIEDAENQKQLKEIEDKILVLLKNAEGNILDDEELIDTLANSKKTSNTIIEKVKVAETTQVRITKVRQGYIPVANLASQLFFIISDLSLLDPMYQYSLDWYMTLFESAIESAEKSKILEDRLRNLNDCFTYLLYKNVCRSLFEKDKLLFSFLLTTKILINRSTVSSSTATLHIDPQELRFLLQGNISMEALKRRNPYESWLSEKIWRDLAAMMDLSSRYEGFYDYFKSNHAKFRDLLISSDPLTTFNEIFQDQEIENTATATAVDKEAANKSDRAFTIDSFKKLCILRSMRPDVMVPAIQEFIAAEMGTKFIESPTIQIKNCYQDSKCFTPIILVLTPGAAPMTELYKLADDLGYSNRLTVISLGQGQGPIAENAISIAAEKGAWVCLQNCHLSVSWLPTLERICEEFSEDTLHPNFRLFLTSEPSPHFPAYVLQNGIKMTNEPPSGIRANLQGTYNQIDETWFEACPLKREFKKMLFGLCFFHSVVRERKRFGALGWNIQYVFSSSDLKISIDQLKLFLDDVANKKATSNVAADEIPWKALAYLAGECNYGGRVTDDKDRRCIVNILDDYYTPDILSSDHKFSSSGVYYPPDNGSLENYRDYIKTLPYNETPEVFGLHDNANISCALKETSLFFESALSLQSKGAVGKDGGKSWNDTVEELSKDILGKIPLPFDMEQALLKYPVRYEESMNTVLTQELLRFNHLLVAVRSSLINLSKAVKGVVVMSEELETMGNAMVNGRVPELWARVAYPSHKPLGSWIEDLIERIRFFQDWFDHSCPTVFWISGFFFTQAFITGTLQNYARKHSMPIDKVSRCLS
jgi:dynein heavy chain, axonemal